MTVCILATSNSEVRFSTPLPLQTAATSRYFSHSNDSDVTTHYVIDDVSFPPLHAYQTKWKRGAKRRGKTAANLRMRAKYRNIDQREGAEYQHSNEHWIKRIIMAKYDSSTIPAHNDATTVPLYVGMSLYHILDTVR